MSISQSFLIGKCSQGGATGVPLVHGCRGGGGASPAPTLLGLPLHRVVRAFPLGWTGHPTPYLRLGASLMAEDKDYFGEKLRLAERAREDAYVRQLDQALMEQMRQKDRDATAAAAPAPEMFTSILVPVDFSTYSADAIRYAVGMADRFASSIIVVHVIPHETTTHAVSQH